MTFRLHLGKDLEDGLVLVDQESSALDAHHFFAIHIFFFEHVKIIADLLIHIGEQGVVEAVLLGELLLRLGRVATDAEHDGSSLLQLLQLIAKAAGLNGAARRIGARIEKQHHWLAGKTAQRNFVTVLIFQREVLDLLSLFHRVSLEYGLAAMQTRGDCEYDSSIGCGGRAVGCLLSWKSGLRAIAIFLLLPSLAAFAQSGSHKHDPETTLPIPGEKKPVKPLVKAPRAVAVLEWSADAPDTQKTVVIAAAGSSATPAVPTPTAAIPGAASGDIPKTARLVPVSIFYQGDYQDAGVYMSQPAPLAVVAGTVYALESAGDPVGFFSLHDASRVQDAWVGFGAWSPLHPVGKAEVSAEDARPHYKGAADGAKKDAGSPAAASGSASKSGTSGGSAGSDSSGDDPDRPTLHRHAPVAANTHDGIADTENVPDPGADPNRPHIRRGRPTDDQTSLPEMLETPENLRQTAAVSDSSVIDDRSFAHLWSDEKERAQAQNQMQTLALKQIAAFQKQRTQAASKAIVGAAPKATAGAATKTPAQSRAATNKSAMTAVPTLVQIQFAAYDLAYQDDPTYVFAAQNSDPGPNQIYVVVVARPDIYGELQVAFSAVTTASQLYLTPRYRLVDAVDSNGDGRAELLLEARNADGRRFVIMQVYRGVATQVFETGLLP